MSCLQPRKIRNPRYIGMDARDLAEYSERVYGVRLPPNRIIKVPCGNCIACQKRKFTGYRMRLLHEVALYPKSIFVTLTFDNDSLSRFRDDSNKSIRLFLDRLRKTFGRNFRHWFVAEFGSKRGRLHYHGILFDCELTNEDISSCWQYGNTFVGYANEITAKYIVKYLTKEDTKNDHPPPRIITSFGIGESWLNTPEAQLCKRTLSTCVYINGFPTPLPRYYIDKMFNKRDKELISYYAWMETPHDVEYVAGRLYNIDQAQEVRESLKKQYKSLGLIFPPAIHRPKIDRYMRDIVSFDTYYNNFIKPNF